MFPAQGKGLGTRLLPNVIICNLMPLSRREGLAVPLLPKMWGICVYEVWFGSHSGPGSCGGPGGIGELESRGGLKGHSGLEGCDSRENCSLVSYRKNKYAQNSQICTCSYKKALHALYT